MGAENTPFCTNPTNEPYPRSAAIRLHPTDDVAIAEVALHGGTTLSLELDGHTLHLPVGQSIPSGHKIALHALAAGTPVRRYGQVIGFASQDISLGEHVHTHNLGAPNFDRSYDLGADVCPVAYVPETERHTFMGYLRADGRVGTRNYVAVIASVNCSAHVTKEIAHYFTPERLAGYPHVDGVIALIHHNGCSMRVGGADHVLLQRTLTGMASHPNVGAFIFVGLGCEVNQIGDMVQAYGLDRAPGVATPFPLGLLIQEQGGVRKTIEAGVAAVNELLPIVNAATRTSQPLSGLTVALSCGGSDGWSGITANPLVGRVADQIVREGGTVVLGETTEIYGAEQMLLRRAVSQEVGDRLLSQVRWWEAYAERMGFEIDNNPTPGNKAGGLTTIYEKSLGAIAKAGSTPLTGVYDYAEQVTARGFTFMDTPGNDWVGVTGQVAGGCNLMVFTTGRGSMLGFKPTPTIKVCSNSTTYEHMSDDMDLNAGRVLAGEDMDDVAQELLHLLIDTASGQPSKSEAQGIGEVEFCPWAQSGVL